MRIKTYNNFTSNIRSKSQKPPQEAQNSGPKLAVLNRDVVSFTSTKQRQEPGVILGKGPYWSPKYKEKIRRGILFIENNQKQSLGEGSFGKVYHFVDIVIKEAYTRKESANEAMVLKKIPKSMDNVQQLIAYIKKRDATYLCTKYINAAKLSYKNEKGSNTIKEKHLPDFMDDLFTFEKLGIYHSDLSRDNLLSNGEKIHFLDFGAAIMFKPEDRIPWCCPDFLMPSNAFDFEVKSLFQIMQDHQTEDKDMKNPKNKYFGFREYLQAKSSYHSKRAAFIKDNTDMDLKQNQRAYEYETLEAKFLENPSTVVEKLEKGKINIPGENEWATFNSPNIVDNVLRRTRAFRHILDAGILIEQEFKNTDDKDYKKYLEYQKEYMGFWRNKLSEWFPLTLKAYEEKVVSGEESDQFREVIMEIKLFYSRLNTVNTTHTGDMRNKEMFKTFDIIESLCTAILEENNSKNTKVPVLA